MKPTTDSLLNAHLTDYAEHNNLDLDDLSSLSEADKAREFINGNAHMLGWGDRSLVEGLLAKQLGSRMNATGAELYEALVQASRDLWPKLSTKDQKIMGHLKPLITRSGK